MKIKHNPLTLIDKVCEMYSKKDQTSISYVCTTDLEQSDIPVDIFYRDTPHPRFGNKYFGLYIRYSDDILMIVNADSVENLIFGLVENDNGELEYSESHHSFKSFDNGNMIDGGRCYIRSSNKVKRYIVREGKMIPHQTLENNNEYS